MATLRSVGLMNVPPISRNALKPYSTRREQHCDSIVNEAAECINEARISPDARESISLLGLSGQAPQANFSPTHFLIASPACAGVANFN
jgi:hypothetical protein